MRCVRAAHARAHIVVMATAVTIPERVKGQVEYDEVISGMLWCTVAYRNVHWSVGCKLSIRKFRVNREIFPDTPRNNQYSAPPRQG
uniref:Secreted protein n=1 Tax=Setaria digitata TaxID=48799 RepID=A0A915PQ12_9BILA